jgi:hypothetical protein
VRALALDSGCAHGGRDGCSRGGGSVGGGGILSKSLPWLILLYRSILLSHLRHVPGYEKSCLAGSGKDIKTAKVSPET